MTTKEIDGTTHTQEQRASDRLAAPADVRDERESAYDVAKRQMRHPAMKKVARPYRGRVQIGKAER